MSFDNSRYTFNPFNSYSSVVMPQGRVQLDADWNEFLAEIARRIQVGTLDIVGRAVYSKATTPNAFYISPSSAPWVVNIGQGRMYIDGLLVENHGPTPGAWDPALTELSGSPQPAPPSITGTPNIPYTSQPYFPGATPPPSTAAGSYVFYLDVWERAVTWLQNPSIVDPAVGIDTSGRLQTVWQVRWMPAATASIPMTCGTPDADVPYPIASAGLLTNGVVANSTAGPCCLTPETGYTGLENQLYRVQIHQGGPLGTATFKWSRENASVATSVTALATQANHSGIQVTVLTVASLGRDQVLNFSNGNWIELLDDNLELNGMPDPNYPAANPTIYGSPGILCQIDYVDPTTNSIYLTSQLNNPPTPSPSLHTRIVRWDQSGTVNSTDTKGNQTAYYNLAGSTGDIPVPPEGGNPLVLENGLTVSLSVPTGGNFLSGDYWIFCARTDGSYDKIPNPIPPRGIHHHYTKLSVVTFDASGTAINTPDCRIPWASSDEGDCGCCTVTVGDNQTSFGKFTSIQLAINSLDSTGGEVCILPGKYYETIIINGHREVTLRGSGPQTVLYPYSADPGGTADQSGSSQTITTESGVNAILTVTNSQHITLTDFTVEAPAGTACILLDSVSSPSQTGANSVSGNIPIYPGEPGSAFDTIFPEFSASASDVTLSNLVLTASTCPAVVAVQATMLNIHDNRIFMEDVASLWPALYVSGAEISIERNWIGLQDTPAAANYASAAVVSDLGANFTASTSKLAGNGGIQIGGYSTGVTVADNEIQGGAFNAITLGAILRIKGGTQVAGLNGLFVASPVTSTGTTLVLPPTDSNNNRLAADGPLMNIRIERNRISDIGLCAIGPVGFFTSSTPEIVGVANLTILDNTISGTLQATLSPFPASATGLGYGAICLPDLQGLVLNDNVITDFGSQPGAPVCGIFILNAEQAEISRNQVIETRDWTTIPPSPVAAIHGTQSGISILMATPPALNQTATTAAWSGSSSQGPITPTNLPVYQPGLPALRMEQNIVRVALGNSVSILGFGPFSITGNHFTTGGTVPSNNTKVALNVLIVNLGMAIEFDTPTYFNQLWSSINNPPTLQASDNALSNSSSGMVLFADNICQVENRVSGESGLTSILIAALDHVTFANNHTWMDGGGVKISGAGNYRLASIMDIMLLGITVQVTSNRLQEALGAVLFSGFTAALLNITSQNISTFCLYTFPPSAASNNLCYINKKDCGTLYEQIVSSISGSLAGGASAPSPSGSLGGFDYTATSSMDDFGDKIGIALDQTDAFSVEHVQQLSVVHQARFTQVNRIATIVTAKSGAASPQAVAATAAVTASNAAVARVAMIKQQVSTKVPAVTSTGWALYGAVYNSSKAPVSAYSVYFVDSTNTYQNAFGIDYTAADGSFKIVYAGPPAGQTAPTTQLFLQAGNASGDPIYTSKTAFTPTTAVATYQVVTLPAGEKPLGVLPAVLRTVTLPAVDKSIALAPQVNTQQTTPTPIVTTPIDITPVDTKQVVPAPVVKTPVDTKQVVPAPVVTTPLDTKQEANIPADTKPVDATTTTDSTITEDKPKTEDSRG